MNVRAEIERYSAPDDVPVLLWLLSRYRWASQFSFVARCRFERYGIQSYQSNRVWSPTPEGRLLYSHRNELGE